MNRLRELRRENHYSLANVSRYATSKGLKMSTSSLSNMETGVTSVRDVHLVLLAELYGVSVDYILKNEKESLDGGSDTKS
ncbi:helix-turn-helix domain-containing protein [Fructobacillus tropaeoli]|uniref:helix-turn-helix domain-containing protein n=1 Tax=Fructobacillus tropaeoli TaxID=709323 RepID=UPI003BA9FACC